MIYFVPGEFGPFIGFEFCVPLGVVTYRVVHVVRGYCISRTARGQPICLIYAALSIVRCIAQADNLRCALTLLVGAILQRMVCTQLVLKLHYVKLGHT